MHHAIFAHDLRRREDGGIVSVPGADYDYRSSKNGERIVIHGGRKKGATECFLLFIDPDKRATLQSLKQSADCALDVGATGRHMVEAALKLVREHGSTRLELDDGSYKRFPSGKSFHLSNVYFITMGKTWYETLIPGLRPITDGEKIETWRRRVLTNRWIDVSADLKRKGVPMPPSEFTSGIDPTQPGSAMIVLRRLKDAHTDYFADYEEHIIAASNIGSLHGKPWEAPINSN